MSEEKPAKELGGLCGCLVLLAKIGFFLLVLQFIADVFTASATL